ncbi:maintenance of telomere capping protein 1 [Phellopilus nigrolimitatus]|nr:maintenance of telomere capping protein 1 [Phellopilus nigrolimitatus]
MSKSKSKKEEALQFLDDLDNLSPAPPTTGGSAASGNSSNASDPADVFKFIDEITQKSSEPTRTTPAPHDRPASRASLTTPTGTLRKATERVRVGSPAPHVVPPKLESSPSGSTPARADVAKDAAESAANSGGWGWGSVWSSASAALQQARTVVDEGVKHLPINEQAVKWREEVMGYVPKNLTKEQLEKLGNDLRTVGYSTFTDILNAVAPPISEHEVIQVWSSHDMEGYDGVESLVYKALARVMEQVDGGDLVVNKGRESKPREKDSPRNMNAVEGIETAFRLAEANIEELIKSNPMKETASAPSAQVPTTHSSVYLRIQPFFTSLPSPGQSLSPKAPAKETHLQFIIYLSDPDHQLTHSTVTQAVPAKWMDHWDTQDWVEDVVVEALRTGVETIGQEYIVARMGWIKEDVVAIPEVQEEEETK